MDNPWLVVPYFQYGIVQKGSSGSGIFNPENRIFGVLSGSLSSCDIPVSTTYGKFHANYNKAAIKNVLNPSHNLWVDQYGIGERRITVYNDLILPGSGLGQYFPANHYQSNNKIVLQARRKIISNKDIRIYTGADYEFRAGESIILGKGFTAENGSTFSAKIVPANSLKSTVISLQDQLIKKMSSIDLPKHREFNISKYLNQSNILDQVEISQVVPNPNDGNFKFEITVPNSIQQFKIELINIQGTIVYNDFVTVDNFAVVSISKSELANGIYILKVSSDRAIFTRKIIKE